MTTANGQKNSSIPGAALPPRLEVTGISKRFGALQALSNVSMALKPGEFRALLGENGAGKSTLVKCIMGVYQPDTGSVGVGDSQVLLKNPRQAHAIGLGMVYQHFTLVENMTVAENMVMAREHVPAVINWKAEVKRLEAFMDTMPFRVKPTAVVRHLSAGEKQKVELLKQLYLQRKILILDEPTSVLTPQEADEMLSMVRGMCTEGRLSVLMITHKFREVMGFCDAVTVLRHGKYMGEGAVRELNPKKMAEMMMGSDTLPEQAPRQAVQSNGNGDRVPRLVLSGLNANDETGLPALTDLSLHVYPHEIVGIAGVSGNGQRELVQVLAGQRELTSGAIRVQGEDYQPTREQIQRHKFHVLPEMPLLNACVGIMTTADNLAFRTFDRPPHTLVGWFLNRRAVHRRATDLIQRYRIKPPWPAARISNLSGGNIQRVVLARELGDHVDVLVAANPCFGLDFKAVAEIRSQIMEARNRGTAVLLVSEDLDEVLELADRILVISDGRIVYETPSDKADRQVIGRHMAGHSHAEAAVH
jgi:simple sugar transport system ATP-binding protein